MKTKITYKNYKFFLEFEEEKLKIIFEKDEAFNLENKKDIKLTAFLRILDILISSYEIHRKCINLIN